MVGWSGSIEGDRESDRFDVGSTRGDGLDDSKGGGKLCS